MACLGVKSVGGGKLSERCAVVVVWWWRESERQAKKKSSQGKQEGPREAGGRGRWNLRLGVPDSIGFIWDFGLFGCFGLR